VVFSTSCPFWNHHGIYSIEMSMQASKREEILLVKTNKLKGIRKATFFI
jgi:hypothetical protein